MYSVDIFFYNIMGFGLYSQSLKFYFDIFNDFKNNFKSDFILL